MNTKKYYEKRTKSNGTGDVSSITKQVGCGRKSWAQGLKEQILLKEEPLFHTDHVAYYEHVTSRFIDKFGFNVEQNKLPEPGHDCTPRPIDLYPVAGQEAERDHRKAFWNLIYKKVGEWAQNQWLSKKYDVSSINKILSKSVHFKTLVWPVINKQWPILKKLDPNATWIEDLQKELENTYDQWQKEYGSQTESAASAVKYAACWDKAMQVVPALADALALHFSVSVTLVLVGLRVSGEIEVESVTSIVPNTVCNISLDKFDPKRYLAVHELYSDWAGKLFSTCDTRVVQSRGTVDGAVDPIPGTGQMVTLSQLTTATSAMSSSTTTAVNGALGIPSTSINPFQPQITVSPALTCNLTTSQPMSQPITQPIDLQQLTNGSLELSNEMNEGLAVCFFPTPKIKAKLSKPITTAISLMQVNASGYNFGFNGFHNNGNGYYGGQDDLFHGFNTGYDQQGLGSTLTGLPDSSHPSNGYNPVLSLPMITPASRFNQLPASCPPSITPVTGFSHRPLNTTASALMTLANVAAVATSATSSNSAQPKEILMQNAMTIDHLHLSNQLCLSN
ncbi:hypothetical protein Moror_3658 [Moniliophthora roreri MCA 2997]|uniref:Uncharacterized protein n=1 Tax=Moniliophthora roreri (strain MCA 2997) TaxID=1381753 RepID=V2WLY6_MONRO|nr:hypothetical protein Moror_3658 [Moniliophthora roreri MCA 2997]